MLLNFGLCRAEQREKLSRVAALHNERHSIIIMLLSFSP
jgi:hypothetical protein